LIGIAELMPHHICTYLYELAQIFNASTKVIGLLGQQASGTTQASEYYAQTLHNGLELLGITAPERYRIIRKLNSY